MSRIENTGRNMVWQVTGTVLSAVLTFANRFIFMKILGEEYLGVSGLFGAILSTLSFADLGISGTLTYCFYRPIASKDKEHLAILLRVFKKFTRIIIVVIFAFGVAILPFIRHLVAGGEFIDDFHLKLYFFLFLIETIISYIYTYRVCYITAKQEAYRVVPFTVLGKAFTVVTGIILLLVTHNYTMYLVSGIILLYIQKIILNIYIKKKYPETKEFSEGKLPQEDKKAIKRNIKGAIYNSFATISVYQTDSILVSAGINIATAGLVSNYASIKGIVLSAVSLMQTSVVASMGDLMVKENKEKQLDVFYTYMMLNGFVLGFAFCGIAILSSPFITLIFGGDKCIDGASVLLMCMAFYITYLTYALNILPSAGGYHNLGAYTGIVEAVVNLAVSIIAMKYFGLPGVFVGTLAAGLAMYILKPIHVFKGMYQMGPQKYYMRTTTGFATTLVIYILLNSISNLVFKEGVTTVNFLLMGIITTIVYTLGYSVVWQRDKHFKAFYHIVYNYLKKKMKFR